MDQTERSMIVAWIFVMIIVLSGLAIVGLCFLVKSLMTKRVSAWVPFTEDFNYKKQFYDVQLRDGSVIKHCWPNAGYMCDINGSGIKFSHEDNINVRPSPDHPEDD